MRSARLLAAVALAFSVVGTACGAATTLPKSQPHGVTATQNPPPGPVQPNPRRMVNGCDPTFIAPPGPFGYCLTGLPHFYCCSSAAIGWSGIVAGKAEDIRGAVPLDPKTKRPEDSAVVIIGPHGAERRIPVAGNGGFSEDVTFPSAGTYHIGVVQSGHAQNLQPFQVAWRYAVLQGELLTGLFPHVAHPWPTDITVLAAPFGRTTVFRIRLENARGVAQPSALLGPHGPRADSSGVVTLHYRATGPRGMGTLWGIATALFVQTYADARPSGSGFTGFAPPMPHWNPALAIRSISTPAGTLYALEPFLEHLIPWFPGPPPPAGNPKPFTIDAKTGLLTITDPESNVAAQFDLRTGEVDSDRYQSPGRMVWTPWATVHPVVRGGVTYLSIPEITRVAAAVFWAAPDGHGGILASDAFIP